MDPNTAAAMEDRWERGRKGKGNEWGVPKLLIRIIPGFTFVILAYVLVHLSVSNTRVNIVPEFNLSWDETLYLFATMLAMFELFRVSKPGINNTVEAIAMGVAAVFQIVLFVLGMAHHVWMGIQFDLFYTAPFGMLMVINITQTIVAFIINARTLQRTIASAGIE